MRLEALERVPVLDETGLSGHYDFELERVPDPEPRPPMGVARVPAPPSDDSRPSIFTALQQELGLKLVPVKAPLAEIVIDHIEKPSPN
jgi:uncharacterized protein (TIGR03435 family)